MESGQQAATWDDLHALVASVEPVLRYRPRGEEVAWTDAERRIGETIEA